MVIKNTHGMQRGYPTAYINTTSDFEVFFNNTYPKAKHVSISSWHELAAHVLVSQLTSVVGTLNSVAPVNYINPSPPNGYLELPVSHCRVLLSGSLSLSLLWMWLRDHGNLRTSLFNGQEVLPGNNRTVAPAVISCSCFLGVVASQRQSLLPSPFCT